MPATLPTIRSIVMLEFLKYYPDFSTSLLSNSGYVVIVIDIDTV